MYKMNYDKDLANSLSETIKNNDQTALESMLKEAGLSVTHYRNEYGCSLLHEAAELGSPRMIEYLLKAGCEVDAQDLDNCTPLIRASGNSDMETRLAVVRLLLTAGVNAKERASGKSAVHFFIDSGYRETATLLFQRGANVNSKTDRHGFTMLHEAAALKNEQTILYLLEQGANPKIDSRAKRSTLQFAIQSVFDGSARTYDYVPSTEVLRRLLEHGADPNAKLNRGGTTVFHKMLQHANEEVVRMFIRHGARVGTVAKGKAVREAASKNKDKRVIRLIMDLQRTGNRSAV